MDDILKWLGFSMQCLSVFLIPLLKSWFSKFEKADTENKNETIKLKDDFDTFKENVITNYLKKEDYYSTISATAKKVDEIYKIVYEIKGELKGRNKKDE